MSLSNLQLITKLQATVQVGSGRFQSTAVFGHVPAGAGDGNTIQPGSAAGQVSDIYNNDPQLVVASGTPTVFVLSTLTDPNGTGDAFQHVSHILFENLSQVQTLTLKPGAVHPVAWGTLPTAGIALPPSTPTQNSYIVLAVPAGLAITSGAADQVQVTTDGGNNVPFNLSVLGRNA